jgi:hypothetical protein
MRWHDEAQSAKMDCMKADKENEELRAEVARQKARSVPIDPSISDKFEIKDHSVFVIRNGTAYLAGIRELADMTELVDARNELAKLRAEVERLKSAHESAGQAAFELQCQTMNERDQWRAVAEQAVEAMKSMRPLEMGKALTSYEKLKGQP